MSRRLAIVVGAGGGIGAALCDQLLAQEKFDDVIGWHRQDLDLCDEASIRTASQSVPDGSVHLLVNAAGLLYDAEHGPEKSLRQLDPAFLARSFVINAAGPALLMKHFLPKMPRKSRVVFASLSARVGSIEDNRLGGWYSYRASKAALNQLIRTAAIEWARTHPQAICVALHPGTVATKLSAPFTPKGATLHSPNDAARHLLAVMAKLTAEDSGRFFDWRGEPVPW